MGNAANSYSTEFPAVGRRGGRERDADAVADLPGAVRRRHARRYHRRHPLRDHPTLLNVGTTPYCGDGAQLRRDQGAAGAVPRLVEHRQSDGAGRPRRRRDLERARASAAASGCAEGMASLISPEAWVRAFPDTAATPSMTGALLRDGDRAHVRARAREPLVLDFHSLNTAADGTDPNRGYNVALRAFLADDHSAMKLRRAWNNNTTILEKADYAFLLCVLGGADEHRVHDAGRRRQRDRRRRALVRVRADRSHDGTVETERWRRSRTSRRSSRAAAPTRAASTSSSSARANSAILQTTGVRVAFDGTIHEDDERSITRTAARHVRARRRPEHRGAEVRALEGHARKRDPALVGAQDERAADHDSFTVTPGRLRQLHEHRKRSARTKPSLTSDGRWVAYTARRRDHVAPTRRSRGPSACRSLPSPAPTARPLQRREHDLLTNPTGARSTDGSSTARPPASRRSSIRSGRPT